MKLLLICCFSFLSFLSTTIMGQEKQDISSWIEKDIKKQKLCFTAYFRNESKDIIKELSYEFSGSKKSPGGNSNVKQSGKFKAEPAEKITLSTVSFGTNQSKQTKITCLLKIYQKNSLLCTDTLDIMY